MNRRRVNLVGRGVSQFQEDSTWIQRESRLVCWIRVHVNPMDSSPNVRQTKIGLESVWLCGGSVGGPKVCCSCRVCRTWECRGVHQTQTFLVQKDKPAFDGLCKGLQKQSPWSFEFATNSSPLLGLKSVTGFQFVDFWTFPGPLSDLHEVFLSLGLRWIRGGLKSGVRLSRH